MPNAGRIRRFKVMKTTLRSRHACFQGVFFKERDAAMLNACLPARRAIITHGIANDCKPVSHA